MNKSITKLILLMSLFCCYGITNNAEAQVILDSQNKITISLKSGDIVTLYGKAKTRDQSFSNEYYYLPANMGLSKKPDGVPEFLFAKYTTEERTDNGGVQGAILHALFQWGLSPTLEKEATKKLKAKLLKLKMENPLYKKIEPEGATINGAVSLKTGESKFRVISATLDGSEENTILNSSAPVLPGAKVAIASKMDKNEAQLLASTFEKGRSITDLSISIDYKYDVLFPAVDGEIIFNWEKLETLWEQHKIKHEVTKKKETTKKDNSWLFIEWSSEETKEVVSKIEHKEMSRVYDRMVEKKVVEINIDKNLDDEIANQITTQFMALFMQSISNASTEAPSDDDEEKKDKNKNPNRGYNPNISYSINIDKLQSKFKKKTERFNLRYRTPITMEGSITENLAAFYDQVQDNENCVYSVNLNDPFFQHRDIMMIMDLEAEDIFKEEINYVTVNVRKKRNKGNDFQDQVTIDRKFIEENGIRASLTYARGEDNNPDNYEYKTQWSLRGGTVYPPNPAWTKGDWEGITLNVPIRPRTIDFEADLEQLKELDIPRATLQVRYLKYGVEYQDNLHISVASGKGIVNKRIFTDDHAVGYGYRLILNHKEKGKLVFDWQPKNINDDYVYATIPVAALKEDRKFIDQLLEAASELGEDTNPDGSVKDDKTILDKILGALGALTK